MLAKIAIIDYKFIYRPYKVRLWDQLTHYHCDWSVEVGVPSSDTPESGRRGAENTGRAGEAVQVYYRFSMQIMIARVICRPGRSHVLVFVGREKFF